MFSLWFEEIYDLFLDTILSGIDIDNYDAIIKAWKKFYDAHHILCDHDDRDGDGQYDNCLWDYMTAISTYDGNGSLISEQTGLFEKTYEYTAENRLAVVKAQGTVLMAALYDGDGNRLFTMDYTGENNDRWDIWIPETGGNADRVDDSARDAMKELAGLVSVTDRRDYTITEYVNDITRENEEVLAELNLRGKITTAYTYGYNGESVNLATGLQYLRARYYNPQIGSFLTEDTYAGQLSNPLTLNRYDYVSNNPVNYIDPSGHFGLKELINGAKQLASDVWDGVTGFVEEAGNAIGNGISALEKGLSAIGNAYMQGQQMIQQNQRIEQQAVSNLLGGNSSQSSQNRLQQALNDKKPLVKPEPEEKDKGILEQIGEGVVKLSQMYSSVEEQKRQLEEEQSRAFCETLQTKEGQKVIANVLGVGVGIAAGVYAAPVIIGYIGLSGTGALVVTNVTIGSVGNASASFLNALIDDKSAGETAADTGLAFLDGAILGAIGGYVEAGIAKLFGLFKGTTIYKTIGKYFDDIFGVVDDIDSVKTPTGDGNNTITDDVVEEIVEGGSLSNDRVSYYLNQSLNNIDSNTTILGTTGNYDEIWKVNKQFIDDQIEAGNRILLSNDPYQGYYFDDGSRRFYQREIDYLKELGYSFKSIGDNLWEAIK